MNGFMKRHREQTVPQVNVAPVYISTGPSKMPLNDRGICLFGDSPRITKKKQTWMKSSVHPNVIAGHSEEKPGSS